MGALERRSPLTIIKTKQDIAAYIKKSPVVIAAKAAHEEDEPGGFEEVEEELVSMIAGAQGAPEFGDDWGPWLTENIEELLTDAISIVM